MFGSLKVVNAAHLVALKLAAAKSVVGVGVLVGGAATGIIVSNGLEADYLSGTTALINEAVNAETGLQNPALASSTVTGVSTQSHAPVAVSDASTRTAAIPQVVITAKRMTLAEKVAHDADAEIQVLADRD